MTYMLSGLAGGRVVVALEVYQTSLVPRAPLQPSLLGRIFS